ncbi:hypothetical protein [Paractinoplanes toevensis]|uniref:Uncharacterized protein n=1 Tax=Paractinoplanes toevensis TaxID=571911 RepID=A0A919W9P1_9ACTN|nr:hypothetical protein [Actinoplanes toevensis]GIM96206.1 hypothetical protein Ato02nite_079990 [Actinoplanes toevensis]
MAAIIYLEAPQGVGIVAGVSARLVLVTTAVLLAGCAADHAGQGGDYTPTVAESTAQRQAREHADKQPAAYARLAERWKAEGLMPAPEAPATPGSVPPI